MKTTLWIVATTLIAAPLCGCGKPGAPRSDAGAAGAPPAWLLAEPPAGAQPVAAVKAAASEGDMVVIRGRIGGRAEPLRADSAVFVIVDPSIPTCADNPDDNCPTPWDYCCEPQDVLTANSATIQMVDPAGTPIDTSLPAQGLKALDEVIVIGAVGPRPNPAVLTIRATGVHRVAR